MSLEQQINTDIKTAMLGKQEVALRALRAVKAALLLAKTSGSGEVSNDEEVKLLQKLVKQRKESLEVYTAQNRADLAKSEQDEIDVIEKYLPKQLSEAEVKAELEKIIAQVGASSAADLGKVMGVASKHFAGKADNKMVSVLVKQLLGA